jgi:pilus assembly protein CpaC
VAGLLTGILLLQPAPAAAETPPSDDLDAVIEETIDRAARKMETAAATEEFPAPFAPEAQDSAALPAELWLMVGELHTLTVADVSRVAVGNPEIVDVTIVSSSELLLHAKQIGRTALVVWDPGGRRMIQAHVLDPQLDQVTDELAAWLKQLGFGQVRLEREGEIVVLVGEVASENDLERLGRLLDRYPDVTNLVTVKPTPPPPPPPPEPPPTSVALTVQLIEMRRDGTDKLGVDWRDSITFTETAFSALGPSGVSQTARLGEAFRFGALSRDGLTAVLNLLVQQGKARVLAEPKLVAASGKQATASLGLEVPLITATSISQGVVTQSIKFRQTGVELKFQPTVLQDQHSIQLAIDAQVSTIDKSNAITVSGTTVPGFRIRKTQTELIVDSGETVLIAGLIQDEETENLSQVPGVGSIPVLGMLFRSKEFVTGQTELIIMVTPELMADTAKEADRSFALERALAGAELAGAVDDPVLRYALAIQDRIAQAIRYPQREKELGLGGRVKLKLHLFQDGTLGRAVVAESSGIEVLDLEALKAAETQAPYPPFPTDLTRRELWLDLPVLFRP